MARSSCLHLFPQHSNGNTILGYNFYSALVFAFVVQRSSALWQLPSSLTDCGLLLTRLSRHH